MAGESDRRQKRNVMGVLNYFSPVLHSVFVRVSTCITTWQEEAEQIILIIMYEQCVTLTHREH